MNRVFLDSVAILAAFLTSASSNAETVKDREGAVRGDRAKMENDARWIYNDVDRGFAEARMTGKPLLVVLRCVPCLACMGIDASILASKELEPLLDQFVCVRVINANALDLSLFQFDYDLSFSTMFFNADGTVYGRYGSWKHQRDAQDATTAGYKAALAAAAAIHRGYPANNESLRGKQGGPVAFKTPVEIPSLAGKYERELKWEGKVVQSCVHCHQIGDAYRSAIRGEGKPMPMDLIYPMPAPETIGLSLEPDHVARVASIADASVAAHSGLQPGDDIISANEQALISVADFAWVLHRLPEEGTLKLQVRRGDEMRDVAIPLSNGWRAKSDISTRVATWPMRAMAFGGMVLADLTDEERKQRSLPIESLGLFVKHVGQYGIHAAAKNAGFQKGDVIVGLEQFNRRMTESELIGIILRDYPAKQRLKTAVLRGSDRLVLEMPLQ
jgi:serine protease Do